MPQSQGTFRVAWLVGQVVVLVGFGGRRGRVRPSVSSVVGCVGTAPGGDGEPTGAGGEGSDIRHGFVRGRDGVETESQYKVLGDR